MDVQLSKITKTYPRSDAPALYLERLELRGGQVHGIIGHSGSGKSTLLNLLSLLDRPDESTDGEIVFYPDGMDHPGFRWGAGSAQRDSIKDEDQWRLRYFSFVFQSGYLLENFSASDNVLVPLRLQGSTNGAHRTKAEQLLTTLGIEREKWESRPNQLSGGQYQRVAVARALVHEPHVVFADEPTGSLDPASGVRVMTALQKWKDERPGNLLILVTHNPDHVLDFCDMATILHEGKITRQLSRDQFDFETIRKAMSGN